LSSAFYDGNTVSDQTGNFVIHNVVPVLRSVCGGKQLFITEYVSHGRETSEGEANIFSSIRSGWPSRGNSNGVAVASLADERSALLNLNCACRDDTSVSVFAFEYDDQIWKGNDNERSFGIFGKLDLNGDVFAPC